MSGFEGPERQDHDERQAGEVEGSVEIRTAQVVSAAGAVQFAPVIYEFA
jgi:hypothetical protein